MKCDFCGYEVNKRFEYCPACGLEPPSHTEDRCYKCGDEIKPGFRFCPTCGNSHDKKKPTLDSVIKISTTERAKDPTEPLSNGAIGLGIFTVFVAIIIGLMFLWNSFGLGAAFSSADNKRNVPDERDALVAAQMIVKDYLKSPSSAKFPSGTREYSISGSSRSFTVSGYVNSNNSFGASIRSDFVVSLKYTTDFKQYTATYVMIGDTIFVSSQ